MAVRLWFVLPIVLAAACGETGLRPGEGTESDLFGVEAAPVTLRALRPTWLKVSTAQSVTLPAEQKCAIHPDAEIVVLQVSGPSSGHQQVGVLQEIRNNFDPVTRQPVVCSLSAYFIWRPHFRGPNDGQSVAPSAEGSGPTFDGSFIWPTASHAVSSRFGWRPAPCGGCSTNHRGIDIPVGTGTNVYASASGQVVRRQWDTGGGGNYIRLDHSESASTVYLHLSGYVAALGQYVMRGNHIGESGSSGNVSGPHLHFGVWLNGDYVDPLAHLP